MDTHVAVAPFTVHHVTQSKDGLHAGRQIANNLETLDDAIQAGIEQKVHRFVVFDASELHIVIRNDNVQPPQA